MNLKRTFGAILTILGIIGLIYTGIGVIQHSGQFTTLIVVGIISILFFFSGIGLVKTTSDQVK
jgi:hypothetical protein